MKNILRLTIVMFFFHCGINTDTPTTPFIFLNPINIPQIAGMYPIDSATSTDFSPVTPTLVSPKPQFILKYYITNTEQQFVGYNLYITASTPSLAETQLGAAYLEDGIQPSFPHLVTESSTDSSKIQKKRILNRKPPPGIFPFQKCEVYTFTMRAVFNNGATSNPSAPVYRCASLNPALCEEGTSCNPSACNTSSCTVDKNSCMVGTLCNPCKVPGKELLGCECPAGTSPPGCNP